MPARGPWFLFPATAWCHILDTLSYSNPKDPLSLLSPTNPELSVVSNTLYSPLIHSLRCNVAWCNVAKVPNGETQTLGKRSFRGRSDRDAGLGAICAIYAVPSEFSINDPLSEKLHIGLPEPQTVVNRCQATSVPAAARFLSNAGLSAHHHLLICCCYPL